MLLCGNCDIFSEYFNEYKEPHLFEIEMFCNIINDFSVTFDQFNVS